MRANAGNDRVALRDKKNSDRTDDRQVERSRNSPRRQVVQKNAVGPNLDGKRQCLPLAGSERTLEHTGGDRLLQRLDAQPRRQRWNGRRYFKRNG